MTTLFVEQLTVIDFSYFHPSRGIVGESWILDVELSGSLDDNGMVFDFAHVKKQIKQHVDKLVDHKFVVPKDYSGLSIQRDDRQLTLNLITDSGLIYCHKSPQEAVALVPGHRIDKQGVAEFIHQHLTSILPDNVEGLSLNLREEDITGAYYHYSHGLKKHFGDCQRIAHGHRSKIMVFRNDIRDQKVEENIATDWKDIYLITEDDLLEQVTIDSTDYYRVGYTANQGVFELLLPVKVCDRLPTDSTVELIAEHLAQKLKQSFPQDTIKVRAFEGVQKGAIAMA
jgi:6-pyruvoyl-tetrahydropterin synthase